jgi:hypothetical protein
MSLRNSKTSGRGVLGSLALAGCLAATVDAQPAPDFSGRWTVAPAPAAKPNAGPPADVRGNMGSGWGTTIAITQDAKQLVVESELYTRYDLQPQPRFVYALDGSETRNTVMMGRGQQPLCGRSTNGERKVRAELVSNLSCRFHVSRGKATLSFPFSRFGHAP